MRMPTSVGRTALGGSQFGARPIGKRMRAKLRRIKPELRKRMHDPLAETGQWLKSIVQGYFNYYAGPGNTANLGRVPGPAACAIVAFRPPPEPETPDLLDTNAGLGQALAPEPHVPHPFPDARFAAGHPR
jgi:RNA-directed DNA polymerase